MQLSDLLDEFVLFSRAANRSERTIRWYAAYVPKFQRFLVEHGYSTECSEITPRMVREYVAALQDEHKPNTVSNAVRTLKAVFNFGVRDDLIASDPTKRVPVPKVPRTNFDVFDPEDVDLLLRACNLRSLTGVRDFAVVMLLFDSGIRASELVGLTDDDIDWQRNLITVYGKGSKTRAVPVSSRTLRAIRRYIQQRRKVGCPEPEKLFLSHAGCPLTYNGLILAMRRLGRKTGMHVHPHKFRHSFAVNALRNEAREFDIQDCLGHSTLHMTKHYARQSAVDLSERHKRFSPADRLRVRV